MSEKTLQAIDDIRKRVHEQEKILEDARSTGTPEEIAKQENVLASLTRWLNMLETEAQYGH